MAEQENPTEGLEENDQPTAEESTSSNTDVIVRPATLPSDDEKQKAQDTLDAVAAGDERVNAFTAIALMLKNLRQDLEGVKRSGQLPRWMRVARVREFKGEGAMNAIASKGVIPITIGFGKVIGLLSELTLKAQEILIQADGGKALLEVGAGMIKTVASDPFYNAITETVGIENPGSNPLGVVGNVVDTAMKIVDKIPDPEDVDIIAKELYLLLAVEQLALPFGADGKVDTSKLPPTQTLHVDVNTTGKVRLMSWALDAELSFHGLKGSENVEVKRLGSRRVWEAGNESLLPAKSSLDWPYGKEKIRIYEFSHTAEAEGLSDIQEADALLTKLGYHAQGTGPVKFDADFAKRLRRFQKLNKLTVNGQLDNSTINRLMNLDFERKSLKRAKNYNEVALQGFDDTKNEDPTVETTE